jgi:hypothetical protein
MLVLPVQAILVLSALLLYAYCSLGTSAHYGPFPNVWTPYFEMHESSICICFLTLLSSGFVKLFHLENQVIVKQWITFLMFDSMIGDMWELPLISHLICISRSTFG